MRYLKGHDKRGKKFPPRGRRLQQIEAARERHAKVIEEYRRGDPLEEIALRHGFEGASSVGWVIARARANGEAIERRNAVARPPLDDETVNKLGRMWRAGCAASEMRAAFGWTRHQLSSAIRSPGMVDQAMRSTRPAEFSPEEQKALKRAASKIKVRADLSDRQRTILRLVQASERPMSSRAIAEVLRLLGLTLTVGAAHSAMRNMKRKGLVSDVPSEAAYRHAPRRLWFVPFEQEQAASALTLADAQRETELAALLREQEADSARGHWAQVDPRTRSLDAEFAKGGSFHDLLEDAA